MSYISDSQYARRSSSYNTPPETKEPILTASIKSLIDRVIHAAKQIFSFHSSATVNLNGNPSSKVDSESPAVYSKPDSPDTCDTLTRQLVILQNTIMALRILSDTKDSTGQEKGYLLDSLHDEEVLLKTIADIRAKKE